MPQATYPAPLRAIVDIKKLTVLAGLQRQREQPGGTVAQSIRIAHRWTFYCPN
jgi:hypothetical protein